MKKGERIFFWLSGAITVLAVVSVAGRYSSDGPPRQARDYYEWSDAAGKGYVQYKQNGCNSCHRVLRMGEAGVAPVLDGEGTRRSEQWLSAYMQDPESMVPGSAHSSDRMGPDFRQFDTQQRQYFVKFLVSLKSNPGSSNYPVPPFKPQPKS
ncbi:MAG TPA: c-type cytochrome [Gammaproteobacteria bacterium]|nr:c-type cytochrome [Gammaproteobacteria bacterium]